VLDRLIEEAGRSNYDLRIAIARVEEARQFVGVVSGEAYPQVGVSANANRSRISESQLPLPEGQTYNSFDVGVSASWELDVFGRIRRSVEAATAEYQATEEDRNDVLISVYAQVGRSYVALRTAQARLKAAMHNIESQREIVELTKTRFKYGLASDLDVAQAEQVLASSEAVVPEIQTELDRAMHALAVLVGKEPSALVKELSEPRPIPGLDTSIKVGVPADLIRRRPDIRRAERRLAAQTARIGVATAQLYPSFNILGMLGLAAGKTSALFTSGSQTYTLGGGVLWNLFAGGSIRSQIRVEGARAEQARLRYEKTVLNALREVEDDLVGLAENEKRRAALERNTEAAARSLKLALELYKDGLRDFQSTLDAERALFDAENRSSVADGATAVALVNLYQALGGGWNPDNPEASYAAAPAGTTAAKPASEVN
jgi:NodT family efflux transporter outer membrane factor (OMF) lipoprotein